MKQYYQKQLALGSEIELSIVSSGKATEIMKFYRELWRQIYSFEKSFSRFLPASELSMFNNHAGSKQIISEEFKKILQAAKEISLHTEGLYNPFILPALQAAGYKNSMVKGFENDRVDDHSSKTVASIDKLEIGDNWARIPYNTAIDLGGCGKGYLADQLAKFLKSVAVSNYWLSLGGDLIAYGTDVRNKPWRIMVQSAEQPEASVAYAETNSDKPTAVATSGTIIHKGIEKGKSWHHLIDSKTLKPAATDVALATMCGKSALEVDVLASCAVILGSHKAPAFLKDHQITDFLLQFNKPNLSKATYKAYGKAFKMDGMGLSNL